MLSLCAALTSLSTQGKRELEQALDDAVCRAVLKLSGLLVNP
jgi:hypothetical protein